MNPFPFGNHKILYGKKPNCTTCKKPDEKLNPVRPVEFRIRNPATGEYSSHKGWNCDACRRKTTEALEEKTGVKAQLNFIDKE